MDKEEKKKLYETLVRKHNIKTREDIEKRTTQEEARRLREAATRTAMIKYNAVLARAPANSIELIRYNRGRGMSEDTQISIWGRELITAVKSLREG